MATTLLFMGLLIPIGLVVLLIVRLQQAVVNDRAQQAAFASRLHLQGGVGDSMSLAGEYDGLPLYVTQERVRGDRSVELFTRARLLTSHPGQEDRGGYRERQGSPGVTFAVRRGEGFSFELAAGLREVPTGDPAVDAEYRCFVAPGERSPWSDPALRSSLRQMPGTLVRIERGAAECAATFSGTMAKAAVLERAVAMLASLASPEGTQRHRAELEGLLDAAPLVEDARVRWAFVRLLVVVFGGAVLVAPLLFMDWPLDVVATIACPPGSRLVHGKTVFCRNKARMIGESAGGTYALLQFDVGWVSALVVFSVFEVASRRKSRRPT